MTTSMTGAALAAILVALGGCRPASDPLAAFEGGFDPTRFDAGPLPEVPDLPGAHGTVRFNVPPFYAFTNDDTTGSAGALDAWLEKTTGLDVEIKIPELYSADAVADALARGDVDVAELSPYQYALVLGRGLGITALAASVAHGASSYGSYIVVRYGSSIRTLEDLKGKKLAFVDPLSTSGYLLPALFLKEQGFDLDKDVTVTFTGSHPASVEAVRKGTVDAAAVASDLLIGQAGLAGPLVVVAKAGRMPYDVIVARPGLDPAVAARVQAALLRLSIHDEGGREALRAFSSVDGFMPVPKGHYDDVIALAKRASPR